MSDVTPYYVCDGCGEEYGSYKDAENCCEEDDTSDEPKPPTAAELEALGQQRLI